MSYNLMLQKAVELHNQGYLDNAESIYRQILETAPQNHIVLNLLGLIAQAKNSHNQAIELFYRAQKQYPGEPMYAFNMGFSLLKSEKFSEAKASFQKALDLSPNFKEAAYYSGVCDEKKGDKQHAVTNYQKALNIDASYFEPKLALCLLDEDINKLMALNEEYKNNYLIKANISKKYFDAGDLQNAMIYAEQAYKLEPFDDEISAFYGTLLLQNGKLEDSRKILESAIKINPKNVSALINAANLFFLNKNFQKAEDLYNRALGIAPENFDAHLNLANLFFNQNRKAEALEEYRAAAILNPKSPELSRNLAALLCEEKEYEDALGLLFNAVNQNNSEEISVSIAETLTLLAYEDQETALKIAENWQKSMPENVFARHTFAALKGKKIEDNKDYSEKLFDVFAENYDAILQKIAYIIPDKIAELTKNVSGKIIDLGCGSGLVGAASINIKQEFTGVDISAKMLEQAEKTGRYKKLIKSDIIDFLYTKPEAKLLIAADVLCYLADLREFFLLAKGYELCFSVEALKAGQDYALQTSGRYAHSKKYIEDLLKTNGYDNIKCYEETIRYENGLPIRGYIFTTGL